LRQRLRGLRRLRWRLRRRLLYMDWTCVYLTDFYWGQNDPAVSEAITGPVVGLVSMAAAFVMTVNGTAGRARRRVKDQIGEPISALNYLNARTQMLSKPPATVKNFKVVGRYNAAATFRQSLSRRRRYQLKPMPVIIVKFAQCAPPCALIERQDCHSLHLLNGVDRWQARRDFCKSGRPASGPVRNVAR
jgi:hypothetical protein